MKFEYVIDDKNKMIADVEEMFCAGREPSKEEKIKILKDENGHALIQANRDGWLFLAKICVEMAYCSEKDPMYHIHRTENFEMSSDSKEDAVSLFCD